MKRQSPVGILISCTVYIALIGNVAAQAPMPPLTDIVIGPPPSTPDPYNGLHQRVLGGDLTPTSPSFQESSLSIESQNAVDTGEAIPGDDRTQSDPTAWWWFHGQTEAQVNNLLNTNNARLIDIKIEQTSPDYRFSVVMVRNTEAYAKTWWWYFDKTEPQVSDLLTANNARLIDIEGVEIGGQTRLAVIMVAKTGADNVAWWWYYDTTLAFISSEVEANTARLISLSQYDQGGQKKYAAVMISNTGANTRNWWWYNDTTPAFIGDELAANDAQLIDLNYDPVIDKYSAIMVACPCAYWWWYIGIDEATLGSLLSQNGARLVSLHSYTTSGQKRFAAVMINNLDAISSRVAAILRGTDGATGLYLKQVNGPVLAALQEKYVFEPASSIKVTAHLYAMQQVQAGVADLSQQVPVYNPTPNSSCPSNTTNGTETLNDALAEMMKNSDNQRTRSIVVTFGQTNINTNSHAIGMLDTTINHTLGCGGPTPNTMTLHNAGLLYEGVANGTLLNAATRPSFYALMAGKSYDFTEVWKSTQAIIDAEAPASLTSTHKQLFKSQVQMSYKAGGYEFCSNASCTETTQYVSLASWTQVPFCSGASVAPRQYVFGIFIHGATNKLATNDTFNAAKAELLREQIRAALSDWALCSPRVLLPIVMK